MKCPPESDTEGQEGPLAADASEREGEPKENIGVVINLAEVNQDQVG